MNTVMYQHTMFSDELALGRKSITQKYEDSSSFLFPLVGVVVSFRPCNTLNSIHSFVWFVSTQPTCLSFNITNEINISIDGR